MVGPFRCTAAPPYHPLMTNYARPGNSESVVAIPHELKVETSRGDGIAIALSWTGNETVYLVVSKTDPDKPRWLHEQDINVAYIGTRPGQPPMVARG